MSFDELMKSLHRDYLASLPQKISNLREQMTAGKADELRDSFHKLKGTGRTYGMPEVSELGACLEEICSDYPDRAITATDHALGLLQDIYNARCRDQAFDLDADARFSAVRKLLQN